VVKECIQTSEPVICVCVRSSGRTRIDRWDSVTDHPACSSSSADATAASAAVSYFQEVVRPSPPAVRPPTKPAWPGPAGPAGPARPARFSTPGIRRFAARSARRLTQIYNAEKIDPPRLNLPVVNSHFREKSFSV